MREDIYSYLKMHLSLLTADIHTLLPRFRSDLSDVFNYRSNIPYLQKKWRKSHAQSLLCHSRVVFGAESLKFGLMEGLLMANEKQDTFSSRCHFPGQQTVHYGPGCVKKWKKRQILTFLGLQKCKLKQDEVENGRESSIEGSLVGTQNLVAISAKL